MMQHQLFEKEKTELDEANKEANVFICCIFTFFLMCTRLANVGGVL